MVKAMTLLIKNAQLILSGSWTEIAHMLLKLQTGVQKEEGIFCWMGLHPSTQVTNQGLWNWILHT